jgi:hypothetical protein
MKDCLVWIHLDSQSMPSGSISYNFLTNSEKRNFSHYFKINVWAYQLLFACQRNTKTKNEDCYVHTPSRLSIPQWTSCKLPANGILLTFPGKVSNIHWTKFFPFSIMILLQHCHSEFILVKLFSFFISFIKLKQV